MAVVAMRGNRSMQGIVWLAENKSQSEAWTYYRLFEKVLMPVGVFFKK
jgi:hypothetical protein